MHFTKRNIEEANKARRLYRHINMPGHKYFLQFVENIFFCNSLVTPEDVKIALVLYGQDISFSKGKSIQKRPNPIQTIETVEIPPSIKEFHQTVVLSVDYLFVHGITMLISIDNSYQFRFLKAIHKK